MSKEQWRRMQHNKTASEKAFNEFCDVHIAASLPEYETGNLIDLLIGLRHLCDLHDNMDFDQAVRTSQIEYSKEKNKFSYPGNPACNNLTDEENGI